MIDFISKLITGILCLFIIAFFVFLGIVALLYDQGFIGVFSLVIALSFIIAPLAEHYDNTKEKRQNSLRKMYYIPESIHSEYGEAWNEAFQKVIQNAIDENVDSDKRRELLQCQRVAKEMTKDSGTNRLDNPFCLINNAFHLTGCHITITDSKGNKITKIV